MNIHLKGDARRITTKEQARRLKVAGRQRKLDRFWYYHQATPEQREFYDRHRGPPMRAWNVEAGGDGACGNIEQDGSSCLGVPFREIRSIWRKGVMPGLEGRVRFILCETHWKGLMGDTVSATEVVAEWLGAMTAMRAAA